MLFNFIDMSKNKKKNMSNVLFVEEEEEKKTKETIQVGVRNIA